MPNNEMIMDRTHLKKRRICFVITSPIHYGRSKLILQEMRSRTDAELLLVVGASALLTNYGDVLSILTKDGFRCDAKIVMTLEGGNSIAMAKTAGIGITEFATAFDNLRPDLVVVRGDRYEILSAVIAAAYLNIPVAHIEGGDLSGTIDESVRHAVTKLSHIHFVTNEDANQRILRMGEDPAYVFDVGAPELEFVAKCDFVVTNQYINDLGVGDAIDIIKPFLMVMQHPVTTEAGKNRANLEETLEAIHKIGIPTIWFWPNVDAGTDEVSKAIRVFRELHRPEHIRFVKYIPPEQFIGLLKRVTCLVGNSSSGVKECSYLGIPVVNIGTRQSNRLKGPNVVDVGYDSGQIVRAIRAQLEHGPYEPSYLYFKENSSSHIVKTLTEIKLYTQKRFHEPHRTASRIVRSEPFREQLEAV